jgi:L-2,4-diaminobutyrate decarboxylase
VARAAAILGLGRRSVVPVAADPDGRIDVAALDRTLDRLDHDGLRAIAVVGTAGTTDRGAVDPLAALADRAAARGAWFHVDAAVGVGFAFSDRLRPRLDGLERADSITADLHKLAWQPIGASLLVVRDGARLAVVRHPSDYLDRPDAHPDADPEGNGEGPLNLVARSLDTSRRFDALKVVASLRATGRRPLGAMVEHLVDTAAAVADRIAADPDLELVVPPSSITVLFRWHPAGWDEARLDAANTTIQRQLFAAGRAVLGRTRHDGRVVLKLTLVNPATTADDIARVLALVRRGPA